MKEQNVIINQERLVKTIYDIYSVKCLQEDKNCELLLNFLLEGPMTFNDIKNAFQLVNAKKSDKTIYGYLNKLKKADLVMEAGKKIITYSESHIKTLTLYSRTARVFYIALELEKEEGKKPDTYFKVIGLIATQLLGSKELDEDCFAKYYDEFSAQKRVDIEKINEIDDDKILKLLSTFDVRATKYIIDTLCWIAFIGKKSDVHSDLVKCFKK